MGSFGGLAIIFASFLCLFLVSGLIKILHKIWWTPTRIRKMMALQGIRGPPCRLIHRNTKEIFDMRREVTGRSHILSHDTLSVVQPHMHMWIKIYGKNYLQWNGSQAQLVITEPELCKEILNNKDRAYPKREIANFVNKLLGDGLVATTEAEKRGKLRKLATQAFHGETLKPKILFTTGKGMIRAFLDGCRGRVHLSAPDHATPVSTFSPFLVLDLQTVGI